MVEDFSRQDLKGKSFRGQSLDYANFSYADIRGVDFVGASLRNANFCHAKFGQLFYWSLVLTIFGFLLEILSSCIIAYSGSLIVSLMVKIDAQPAGFWSGISALFLLSLFIFVAVKRGLEKLLGIFAIAVALGIAIVAGIGNADAIAAAVVQAVAISGVISGAILSTIAISTSWNLFKFSIYINILLSLIAAVPGIEEGLEALEITKNVMALALIISGTLAVVFINLSFYMSWRVVRGDGDFFVIPLIVNRLASYGGTSFISANLTDANFTQANLKSVDFRQAVLKRVNWFKSSHLRQARLQGTYLEDPRIRMLVITKKAVGQNYDQLDLRGLNLEGASLQDSSFIDTDFSESNLQEANLTRAKLVKTKLYGTYLSRSCLNGACIQDWVISTDTQLEQVKCTHIYMRLSTQEDPDPWRKPDNRNETFKEDDFTDFITPIIKTLDLYRQQNFDPRQIANTFKSLDLYHYGGIDPAAAAVALQQLTEENPEASLKIVALEGRGKEKIRLQAAVASTADSSRLNAKYFEKYHEISSLPYPTIQDLLIEALQKDERIRTLERVLVDALDQPKFYVETYQNQGEFILSQSKGNVNISGVQGSVSGIAAAGESQNMAGVSIGVISGSVTNTIEQLPASPDPNSPGIKELLTQLQAAIESESELTDEDKAEALEQVKIFAEAGQKPEDNALQKAARTSMKVLKGTVASLPNAAQLAEACAKLLPAIATLLALV